MLIKDSEHYRRSIIMGIQETARHLYQHAREWPAPRSERSYGGVEEYRIHCQRSAAEYAKAERQLRGLDS